MLLHPSYHIFFFFHHPATTEIYTLSLHRRSSDLGAIKNRNVLTRAERIAKLLETERWKEGDKVLGLPKVRVMKLALKKKKKADRKSTRLNSSHGYISYAVFCLKKKKKKKKKKRTM